MEIEEDSRHIILLNKNFKRIKVIYQSLHTLISRIRRNITGFYRSSTDFSINQAINDSIQQSKSGIFAEEGMIYPIQMLNIMPIWDYIGICINNIEEII